MKKRLTPEQKGFVEGFRSGLEDSVAEQLRGLGVGYEYETKVVRFIQPARSARYTPDFILPNGIIVETKGRFVTKDRQKHLLILDQHPDLDIRFVFSNSKTRISKQSQTTYAMWCDRHGFMFADRRIPTAWIAEPAHPLRFEAIEKAGNKL